MEKKIEGLMSDPYIIDIVCHGPDKKIQVYHKKRGVQTKNIVFSGKELDRFFSEIGLEGPYTEGKLPDGSIIRILSFGKKRSFSIRRFSKNPVSVIDLIGHGYPKIQFALFWLLLENNYSLIVFGNNTCMLVNALASFIPLDRRVFTLEANRKINLDHPKWTIGSDSKEISRSRPDFLVVASNEHKEIFSMYNAINSGYPVLGGIDSRCRSLREIIGDLQRRYNLPLNYHRSYFLAVSGQASITSIAEFTRNNKCQSLYSGGPVMINKSSVLKDLQIRGVRVREEIHYRNKVLKWMKEHKIHDFSHTSEVFHTYSKKPGKILSLVERDKKPRLRTL